MTKFPFEGECHLRHSAALPFGFRLAERKLVLFLYWSPRLSPGEKPYWIPPLPQGGVGIVVRPVWPSSGLSSAPRSTPVGTRSGGAPTPRSRPLLSIPAATILEGRGAGWAPRASGQYPCGRRGGDRPAPLLLGGPSVRRTRPPTC